MKTTINTNSENTIYVSFHIGRGGHFNNPGHLTFHGEEDFQDLLRRCSDDFMLTNDDEDGNILPDADWQIVDNGSNVILQGRDEIEAMTGRLEWDGIYDTDYVKTTDNLSNDEIEAIWKVYKDEEYMSDELKDVICTLKGVKRADKIKCYPTNITVFIQGGEFIHIDTDQMAGEYTRDEWKEDLESRGFCPLSVEKILDEMEYCGTNDTDFFADED